MDEKQTPTQDDKIVGALGHAAIIFPMWGIIAPALIWVTQREKSEYIRQQSAQALAWQALYIILLFTAYVPLILLTFGDFIITEGMRSGQLVDFFLQFCGIGAFILLAVLPILMGIYAAVRNIQGHNFIYPFVGQRVRAYLAK